MTETKPDSLITSAKLSGQIEIITELRDWLDAKVAKAEEDNDQLREKLADQKHSG